MFLVNKWWGWLVSLILSVNSHGDVGKLWKGQQAGGGGGGLWF